MTMRCEICRNDAVAGITVNMGNTAIRFAVCEECADAAIAFLHLRAGIAAPSLPPSNETEALGRYADDHAGDPATNPTNN